ncbi:hypothetical protein [Amycolatopsis speibonae]|uniref:Secreted protein n=1 Tax=Amycolatopsis speibonae TaxID=1450224 RepID=A0ABV7P197_9PSEU
MVRLKRIFQGLSVGVVAMASMAVTAAPSSASAAVPRGPDGVSHLSVAAKTARTAAVLPDIVCTIQTTIDLVLVSIPGMQLPSVVTAKSATTCPVPMDNLTAQVELYEVRNGSLAIAGIGNFGNGPGFQQSSQAVADCPVGAVRTYLAIGNHTAAKASYVSAKGRSGSGAYTFRC